MKSLLEKVRPYIQANFASLVEFRDRKFMYNQQVNTLLEANYRGISMLYKAYQTGFEKIFSLDSLQHMLRDARMVHLFPDDKRHQLFAFAK